MAFQKVPDAEREGIEGTQLRANLAGVTAQSLVLMYRPQLAEHP